jgi:hypothetical protein
MIFPNGYRRLILGRTTTLPANHATANLQRGSLRATRSQNGKRPRPQVPFYGFMGNRAREKAFSAPQSSKTLIPCGKLGSRH